MEACLRPFNLDGEKLKGCELCWTCGYFNAQTYKCFVPLLDAEKRVGMRLKKYRFPISRSIKKPESRSCLWWKDGRT